MRNVDSEEGEEKAFKLDSLFTESNCIHFEMTEKPFKHILSKLIINDLNEENRNKLRSSIISIEEKLKRSNKE